MIMKLTLENLIELRNSAQYKLHFERELDYEDRRKLEDSLDNLEEMIDEQKRSIEWKSKTITIDDNLVVYSKGNNLMRRMRLTDFTFKSGRIEKQYDGADIARHGRPVYETITEIKNIDDNSKIVINDYERNEFLQKDFCKVNDLENAVQEQYDSLELQIQMIKNEQKTLINNYNKVLDSFEERELGQKEEQELEEIEL